MGGVILFHNNREGTFSDKTKKAGLEAKPGQLEARAVLSDIDNDGLPDLLVAAYTDVSVLPKDGAVFPDDLPAAQSRMYRNKGDGSFIHRDYLGLWPRWQSRTRSP